MVGVIIFFMISGQLAGIIKLLSDFSNKALLTEFAVSVCKDSGENSIASKVDLGGKIMIISVSIPIISSLLETIIKILP